MHLRYKIVIMLVVFAAVLVACGDKHHFKDLRDYIDSLRKHKSQFKMQDVIDNKAKSPQPETYKASTLRVPFLQNQPPVGHEPVQTTNPLQAYPLNVLRFVGTIARETGMYAYVVAPDGVIYEVKEGDLLGDRYGKVTSIVPNQISVRELVTEAGKTPTERTVTLQLKDAR